MNRRDHIPPFYFPTQVFFVDDDIGYLQNLILKLDTGMAFQLFASPENALIELNTSRNPETLTNRLFSRFHHTDDLPATHHVIDVNLDLVHREVYNESRFELISVVVVDYDMPIIDGLEFCRNIKYPDIKKVLLTGKADEKIAVEAFNEGIIDRFILKGNPDVFNVLNQTIHNLQRIYFSQIERMLSDALTIGKHTFLRDTHFPRRFKEICDKLHIVEYYLRSEPDGMLMLDADGAISLLIVPNEDAWLGQYEIAFEQAAPQELLNELKSNRILPYFSEAGYYTPDIENWRDYLYPATQFKGDKWYLYTIVKNPSPFVKNKVLSYNRFLDEFDERFN